LNKINNNTDLSERTHRKSF